MQRFACFRKEFQVTHFRSLLQPRGIAVSCTFNYITKARTVLSICKRDPISWSTLRKSYCSLVSVRHATLYVRYIHTHRPYPTYIMSLFMFINIRKRGGNVESLVQCGYMGDNDIFRVTADCFVFFVESLLDLGVNSHYSISR